MGGQSRRMRSFNIDYNIALRRKYSDESNIFDVMIGAKP
jgi:hypothetical protein